MVKVRIENAYACGRTSSETIDLPNPTGSLAEWWEEVVFPNTGDGHPCGSHEEGLSDCTIVAADDPALLGQTMGWQG